MMRDPALAVVVLVIECAGLVAIVGGLAYMVGLRALGGRLAALGFVVMIVAFVLAPYRLAVAGALDAIPRWLRLPLVTVVAVVVGLQLLRVAIRLLFGPRVADTVTADLLSWTIKGGIRAASLPHRLVTFVGRLLANDTIT